MPSRLEELKDLRDMVRENEGVATSIDLSELEDLLAVVEVAKDYIAEFDAPVPDLNLRVAYRAKLRESLAKLDEVQP